MMVTRKAKKSKTNCALFCSCSCSVVIVINQTKGLQIGHIVKEQLTHQCRPNTTPTACDFVPEYKHDHILHSSSFFTVFFCWTKGLKTNRYMTFFWSKIYVENQYRSKIYAHITVSLIPWFVV